MNAIVESEGRRVDPTTQNDTSSIGVTDKSLIQSIFSDYLHNRFLRIGRKQFQVISHSLQGLISALINSHKHLKVPCNSLNSLLLSDGVKSNEDARVCILLEKLLNVLEEHLICYFSRRKFELRFEKSVIQIQDVDVFGALNKLTVGQFWRVKMGVVLKHLPVKPKVSRVEDRSHVAFDQRYS